MTSCTVLISHADTPKLLRVCLSQVKKHMHPKIDHDILVVDQSTSEVFKELTCEFSPKVRFIHAPKIDAGYPIDFGCYHAKGKYLCSLDCDAFPIHDNWLMVPIKMIENHGFGMVGHRTGLDISYPHKGKFFELNNYYRVSHTSLIREVSQQVGFMRPQIRARAGFKPKNREFEEFCSSPPPFDNDYADVGVVANWYIDRKKLVSKLGLSMSRYSGATSKDGVYGMFIEDLVYHLVYGYAEDHMTDVGDRLGSAYLDLRSRIAVGGLDDELIARLKDEAKNNRETRTNSVISEREWRMEFSLPEVNDAVEKYKSI